MGKGKGEGEGGVGGREGEGEEGRGRGEGEGRGRGKEGGRDKSEEGKKKMGPEIERKSCGKRKDHQLVSVNGSL